jgi:hypothetical protein
MFVPADFYDVISGDLMTDPVMASDGHSYSRDSITEWMQTCTRERRQPTSPMTREVLTSTDLQPNITLKKAIEEYNQEQAQRAALAQAPTRAGAGTNVCVTEDCQANTESAEELAAGCVGKITEIDGDGHALIKFDGYDHALWITQNNFGNLQISTAGAAAGGTTATAVTADIMTLNELGRVYAHLDPLRELLAETLDGWQPPQLVAVGPLRAMTLFSSKPPVLVRGSPCKVERHAGK